MSKKNNNIVNKSVVAFLADTISAKIFTNVTAELGFEDVSIFQGTIENALGFLKENITPKVLVVDISGREMPIKDIVTVKELCDPSVAFVVIGEENDVGIFRKLLSIGVKDYLIKPLNLNLVRESFGGILIDKTGMTTFALMKGGRTIGFIPSVGGTGATTFAANYAWGIATIKERKTVLIDLNFYSGGTNLILDMNFNDDSFVSAMVDIEKIDEFFLQTFARDVEKKLFYIGYNEQLGIINDVPSESVSKLLNVAQENYNYTIVDIPRFPQKVFIGAVSECDYIYVIAELTISSARETSKLLEYLIKQQGRQNVSVILNKIGIARRGALSKEAFEKVIGKQVHHVCAYDPINPVSALNLGQPLVKSRDNEISKIVNNLIDEISNKKQFDVLDTGNEVIGLFKRLFKKG